MLLLSYASLNWNNDFMFLNRNMLYVTSQNENKTEASDLETKYVSFKDFTF